MSLVSASLTVMLHRPSSRLAKARVNSSGMCCTITMPGASAGSASSSVFSASVPPVEAPITTTFSVVSAMACVAGERIASAVSLGSTVWLGPSERSRAAAAAFTASQSVMRESSRNCLVPRRGLVMISTAPYSSALSVLCAPSSARLEQITTGIGCWLMIFLQEGEPVHARHFDVERDHVRHLLGDALGGDKRIAGRGDHFDLRIGGEHLAQRLAHHGRVVDDQYANFGCCSQLPPPFSYRQIPAR